jgi:hypothetical protein
VSDWWEDLCNAERGALPQPEPVDELAAWQECAKAATIAYELEHAARIRSERWAVGCTWAIAIVGIWAAAATVWLLAR